MGILLHSVISSRELTFWKRSRGKMGYPSRKAWCSRSDTELGDYQMNGETSVLR